MARTKKTKNKVQNLFPYVSLLLSLLFAGYVGKQAYRMTYGPPRYKAGECYSKTYTATEQWEASYKLIVRVEAIGKRHYGYKYYHGSYLGYSTDVMSMPFYILEDDYTDREICPPKGERE